MWLKLCLLLAYILLLFLLSRVLEAISWCESGISGALSRQLMDPMVLSVAKLKALLEQRGVSYEGVVEKSELTSLVDTSGQVSAEEVESSLGEDATLSETNFTSGAHFIEQVEDAKDSVWLVQVVSNTGQFRVLSDSRWKTIQHKASKFGVRTGFLDCSLDSRYCYQKGWLSPFLLLALPSQFEKKASVAMYNYSGSVRETSVLHWVRDKLDERVVRIKDPIFFQQQWKHFDNSLDPEIRAVLFTESSSAPLFYSALSVKFPGRVKFGLVSINSADIKHTLWKSTLKKEGISHLPTYMIYSAENKYSYGMRPGEQYWFTSMERFFKFLYPCLNDIFIISFCVANVMAWFELFISNCCIAKRIRNFIWCMFKYNVVVIMLWLPIIGFFQLPYLDRIPLLALKLERTFSTSHFGVGLRADYDFYLNHPVYIYLSFVLYLIAVTVLCKKYRIPEQDEDDWFNFAQMGTLTHLRPNDFFEPMRIGGYDLMGGLEVFGSQLSQPSLWLQPSISSDYIQHLPTWRFCPVSLAERAAENVNKVKTAMGDTIDNQPVSSACAERSQQKGCSVPEGLATPYNSSAIGSIPPTPPVRESTSVSYCVLGKPSVCSGEELGKAYSSPCRCQHPTGNKKACEPARDSKDGKKLSNIHSQDLVQHQNQFLVGAQAPGKAEIHNVAPSSGFRESSTPFVPSEAVLGESQKTSLRTHCDTFNPTTTTSCVFESSPSVSSNTERVAVGSSTPLTPESPTIAAATLRTSGFPPGYIESYQCVICLDEYASLTMLCGLPCGHVFHETCIISWLNKEKHFCPMCRWPSYKLKPFPSQP